MVVGNWMEASRALLVTKTAKDVYFATYGTGSRCKTMNSDDDEVFSKVGGRSSYDLQFISHHTIHTDTTFDFFGSCRERRDSLPTPAHFLHLEAGRKGRKGRKRVAVTAATTTPRQRLSFELIVAHFLGFGIAGHEQLVRAPGGAYNTKDLR
jgi:hypothetical protein